MNRLFLIPALLAACLALLPSAEAGSCRRVVVNQRAVVVEQAVVVPAVVTPVVAVAQYLSVPVPAYPLYGIGQGAYYGNSGASADNSALSAEINKLSAEIAGHRDELGRLRALLNQGTAPPGTQPTPAPPGKPAGMPPAETLPAPKVEGAGNVPAGPWADGPKLLASIKTSCARCHTARNLAKGATTALLNADGTLAKLTRAQKTEAIFQLATARMPRGGPQVSQETLDLFAAYVDVP
jgi:hypothetical protein